MANLAFTVFEGDGTLIMPGDVTVAISYEAIGIIYRAGAKINQTTTLRNGNW